MSLLPRTKFGDCSCGCGQKDIEVIKVGKLLYCLSSYRAMKTKQQVSKANVRNQVRRLGNKQVSEGNYFMAEKQALTYDLDFCFSRIVRMMGSDSKGNCQCYTCPTNKHWSMMQCGHFEKRGNTQIRWDFRNAKPQCKNCNENLDGNYEIFAERLNQEEVGLAEQLKEISREPYKWSREEMKQLLTDLRQRLRIIETKFKTEQ